MVARRLLIVSGKGGVGKSTAAAALALALSQRGLRTIVAELAGRTDVPALLGSETRQASRETAISPRLHHITIERRRTLEEYLRHEVPGPLPAGILARSRTFERFVEAAPGLQELLSIGKVWELAQHPRRRRSLAPYDVVVLDAPATGQLMGLLQAPRTFTSIARVGPVARQGAAIEAMLRDREQTGVVIVTTPEQMAVTEALGLRDALQSPLGIGIEAFVVNRVVPERFSAQEVDALSSLPDDPAMRSARWLYGRARLQRSQLARLRRGAGEVSRLSLPFVFSETFDLGCLERLAGVLGRALP